MSAAVWTIGVDPPRLTPLAELRYGDVVVWTDAEGREQVRTVYRDPGVCEFFGNEAAQVLVGHHAPNGWLIDTPLGLCVCEVD